MKSLKLNCKFEVMVSANYFGEEKTKLSFLVSKEKQEIDNTGTGEK